ncbi:MAG: hypothetical protein NTY12_05475 [Candidatus Falkowbacteria bacterium]|nr:hypothetical protein [Candidatus Falkowbacteria bacterium]
MSWDLIITLILVVLFTASAVKKGYGNIISKLDDLKSEISSLKNGSSDDNDYFND